MYGCETWTIKKGEIQRIDAFKLRYWRSLQNPLEGDQPVNPKENNPAYSLEGLILKLTRQYFGHLMLKVNALDKTLMLGKIKGRRRGVKRMKWLNGITNSMAMKMHKFREIVKDREAWHAAVYGVTKRRTQPSN